MALRRIGGLHAVAVVLAVLSTSTVLGGAVTAGVVQSRGDGAAGGSGTLVRHGAAPGMPDYSGWSEVRGAPGPSQAPARYRVPSDWETQSAQDPVEYGGADGTTLASGHATSFYYGNACSRGGQRIPGAWVAFADTEQGGTEDLVAHAEQAVRAWGKGYGTNSKGVTGPMTAFPGERVEVADGTTAGRARMEIDMTRFSAKCLPETAEVVVTSIDTRDGVKSLVQGRYLLEDGAVSNGVWEDIADSLEQ